MSAHTSTVLVDGVRRLEDAGRLDPLVAALAAVAEPLDRTRWSGVLRADLLGHALHPLLTDLPLGCWTSAVLLDLRGRPGDRAASRTLVAAGLAAVVPTAVTGLAEWARTGRAERRVGAAHAALNGLAAGLFTVSLLARGRGRHRLGTVSALAGAGVVGASGYLGGHLTTARKVGSRDPAFQVPAEAALP
ncbi:hypothetical protein GCM10023168_17070 [Fodinibacter luteus]|uniref:DUF2231 domain-containing protein n=1 Tax=Fodinibacter luteus TaxID=552064 RepID=A0ABP8KDQ8_9MICO